MNSAETQACVSMATPLVFFSQTLSLVSDNTSVWSHMESQDQGLGSNKALHSFHVEYLDFST